MAETREVGAASGLLPVGSLVLPVDGWTWIRILQQAAASTMPPGTMIARAMLAVVIQAVTSAAGEEEWQLGAEGAVRAEDENSQDAAMPDSWKSHITAWKMAGGPSPQSPKRSRHILAAKGVRDHTKPESELRPR